MNEQKVHPQIRSRKWVSETECYLLPTAPPNIWHRFFQRLLLGWKWEAVVVVVVPAQDANPTTPENAKAIPLHERNGILAK